MFWILCPLPIIIIHMEGIETSLLDIGGMMGTSVLSKTPHFVSASASAWEWKSRILLIVWGVNMNPVKKCLVFPHAIYINFVQVLAKFQIKTEWKIYIYIYSCCQGLYFLFLRLKCTSINIKSYPFRISISFERIHLISIKSYRLKTFLKLSL